MLALGSEDKSITVSNAEGDTVRQTALRAEPYHVLFSEMKGDERSSIGENTVRLHSQTLKSDILWLKSVYKSTFGKLFFFFSENCKKEEYTLFF